MKPIQFIAGAFLCVSVLSSCVSNKKYKEAIASRDNLQEQYNDLQSNYNKLENDNKQALKNQQTALNEKENALSDERRNLDDMKALIDAQRNAIRNLKQEVCSALKCFTPDELSIEVRDGKLYVSMSDKLLFPSGSDIVNKRGQEAITMLAAVLSNSDLEIMVEGHTDSVPISSGRNKDNWDLSAHRATSVTRILAENGIPPQRIIASGRGKFHPVAGNETSEGRQANRRTEIVLAPKLDKLWKLTEGEDISTSNNMNKEN
jgi:chemotaxis protein MotB